MLTALGVACSVSQSLVVHRYAHRHTPVQHLPGEPPRSSALYRQGEGQNSLYIIERARFNRCMINSERRNMEEATRALYEALKSS